MSMSLRGDASFEITSVAISGPPCCLMHSLIFPACSVCVLPISRHVDFVSEMKYSASSGRMPDPIDGQLLAVLSWTLVLLPTERNAGAPDCSNGEKGHQKLVSAACQNADVGAFVIENAMRIEGRRGQIGSNGITRLHDVPEKICVRLVEAICVMNDLLGSQLRRMEQLDQNWVIRELSRCSDGHRHF